MVSSAEYQNDMKDYIQTPKKIRLAHRRKSAQINNKVNVKKFKKESRKDKAIQALILEVTFYLVFLFLILSTALNYRDPVGFEYRTSVLNVINVNKTAEKVSTIEDFWKWVNATLVPFLHPQKDWNGRNDTVHPLMVSDFASYRIGPLRLRQHRANDNPCTIHPTFEQVNIRCVQSWSVNGRETRNFKRKWEETETEEEFVSDDHEWTEWEYRPWSSIGGTPVMGEIGTYPPGGYIIDIEGDIFEVNRTIGRLQHESWLDKMTRFLVVEVTLYCPHANLFAMVPVMYEVPEALVFMGQPYLIPFRLFSYFGTYWIVELVLHILVCLAIIWFIIREILKIVDERCRYFTNVWNLIELVNLILSVASLAIYVTRHMITSDVAKQVTKVSGHFYNFETLAMWDQLFGILFGFVCFLSTLQMLNLLRFNQRMSVFAATIREAASDLSAFFIVFWIVFVAFASFCYMMFGIVMLKYSSMARSLETLVTVSLGQFDYKALRHVNRIFAPTFLFLYMLFMVFILINMLITILNDAFAVVREDISKQANDHELIDYIISSINNLKLWQIYPWTLICGKKEEPGSASESPVKKIAFCPDEKNRSQSKPPSYHDNKDKPIFKTTTKMPTHDGLNLTVLEDDGYLVWSPGSKMQKSEKAKEQKYATSLTDSFMMLDEFQDFQQALNESRNMHDQEVPNICISMNPNNHTDNGYLDESDVFYDPCSVARSSV